MVLATISSRSCSTFMIGGTTHFEITPSTIKKIASTTKKVPLGIRKFCCSALGRQVRHAQVTHGACYCAPGVANTNSAMNARLMK